MVPQPFSPQFFYMAPRIPSSCSVGGTIRSLSSQGLDALRERVMDVSRQARCWSPDVGVSFIAPGYSRKRHQTITVHWCDDCSFLNGDFKVFHINCLYTRLLVQKCVLSSRCLMVHRQGTVRFNFNNRWGSIFHLVWGSQQWDAPALVVYVIHFSPMTLLWHPVVENHSWLICNVYWSFIDGDLPRRSAVVG